MEHPFPPRGFLPPTDPLTRFDDGSDLAMLDELGRDLPSLLQDRGFRRFARELNIPPLRKEEYLETRLQLYYTRVGFLASAYVNQVGEEPATVLPRNLAVPLHDVCRRLGRPPILSYDGYALSNWKRFRPEGPVALGNIDTIQNFVHLYDERWFILVHVEIEALASSQLHAIGQIEDALATGGQPAIDEPLAEVVRTTWSQVEVLRRIPEKMDPALYYRTFRPYIRFFEGVVYEGVEAEPMNHRGETGAQSSVVPALVSLLKIPHRSTQLTDHLADMRRFMPGEHRALLARIESIPPIREHADRKVFNEALEALAAFRETHLDFAERYIARWVADPRGTGGTLYLRWLRQLIDETRAWRID